MTGAGHGCYSSNVAPAWNVHQASVVCCVLIGAPGRKPQKLLRSFGTTTRDLKALQAWLAEHGVTHVGMESTGVYWKPVYAPCWRGTST